MKWVVTGWLVISACVEVQITDCEISGDMLVLEIKNSRRRIRQASPSVEVKESGWDAQIKQVKTFLEPLMARGRLEVRCAIPSRRTVLRPNGSRNCLTSMEQEGDTGEIEVNWTAAWRCRVSTTNVHRQSAVWMSMVEAKDALHVKPRACFTAWHAELAWKVLFVTPKRQKQASGLMKHPGPSPQCQMPLKLPREKLPMGTRGRHLDHPQEIDEFHRRCGESPATPRVQIPFKCQSKYPPHVQLQNR